ncbi:MAG: hypothetical protein ACWA5P_09295 [bacterium]
MLLKVKRFLLKPYIVYKRASYSKKFQKFILNQNIFDELNIFDLDNTLADTYPNINQEDTTRMYSNLPVLEGMASILKDKIQKKRTCIILTARQYKYESVTKFWIQKNLSKKLLVIIVPSAFSKLAYLKLASSKYKTVNYYDDLSYNHENGKVLYYEDVIQKIELLDINYYNYNQIKEINNLN